MITIFRKLICALFIFALLKPCWASDEFRPSVPTVVAKSGFLSGLCYDGERQRVYLSNSDYDRVETFDLLTSTWHAPIAVGSIPEGLDISHDGAKLYVLNTGEAKVSVLDLTQNPPVEVERINLGVTASRYTGSIYDAVPRRWRCAGEDTAFFNYSDGYQFDLNTHAVTEIIHDTYGHFYRTGDGNTLILGNFSTAWIYNCQTSSFESTGTLSGFSGNWWDWIVAIAITNDKSIRVATQNEETVFFDSNWNIMGTVPGASIPDDNWDGLVFSPQEHVLYRAVSTGGYQIEKIDVQTMLVSGSISLPERLIHRNGGDLKINDSGEYLFAASTSGLMVIPTGEPSAVTNLPPEAYDQEVITKMQQAVNITLQAIDLEEDPVSYTVSSPTNGVLSGTAPNLIYTPNPGFYGHDSFTFNADDGSGPGNTAMVNISIYEPNPFEPTSPVVLPKAGFLAGLCYDPGRGRIYLSNLDQNQVETYDLTISQWLNPIAVGSLPEGLDISPDGTKLYVLNTGAAKVSVVDLTQNPGVEVERIDLGVTASRYDSSIYDSVPRRWLCAGDHLAFFNYSDGYQFDLNTHAVTEIIHDTYGHFYRTRDGRTVILGNFKTAWIYNNQTSSFESTGTLPGFNANWWDWIVAIAITNDKSIRVATQNEKTVFFDSNWNVLGTLPGASYPNDNWDGLVFSPRDDILYRLVRTGSNKVEVIDVQSMAITGNIALPERLTHRSGGNVKIDPEGEYLYAASTSGLMVIPTGEVFTNTAPIAVLAHNRTAETIVEFDATGSYDSDGDRIFAYEWKLGEVIISDEASFTNDFGSTGYYDISLRVKDEFGLWSETQTVNLILMPDNVLCVDQDVIGGAGDGSTWENAFVHLQDALDVAASGDEIWVAEGEYHPVADTSGNRTPTDPRTKTFKLIEGVAVYGGFIGNDAGGYETERSQREWENHIVVLSGDLNGDDDSTKELNDSLRNNNENVRRVSIGAANAILDGFIVNRSRGDSLHGGGLYINTVNMTVRNCHFTENWAWYGAGIRIENFSSDISGCTFTNNLAHRGAGISIYKSNSVITDCTFLDNSTPNDEGGALHNENADAIITGCDFYNNSAGTGGALYTSNGGFPIITSCNFTGNTAGNGGAVKVYGASPRLTNCTFVDNSANSSGGAVYHTGGSPNFEDCLFSKNSAYDGGAVYNYYLGTSPTYRNCTFIQNNADGHGGAVVNTVAVNSDFINCLFQENHAGWLDGGAMWSGGNSVNTKIINCSYINNTTTGDCGAIRHGGEESILIVNSLFYGNSAASDVGAITVNCPDTKIINSIFANNSAASTVGGIYALGTTQIQNCIVWNNTAPSYKQLRSSGTITISNSDIKGSGGSGASWISSLGIDGGGNIDADPFFANPTDPAGSDGIFGTYDDGLRLTALSPCIDAGDDSALPQDTADLDNDGDTTEDIPLDIIGFKRVLGSMVDMGAYEINTLPGDIDGNDTVDLGDFLLLRIAFGSNPTKPNWNPAADINNDGGVNLGDFFILRTHYGERR
ncbi:MAG: hypothetical protein JXA52_06745 [Planctomycetes bacterium]|nr:hypothetical protein [Planctomycetota bacterium]